eukprot:TRINITY_DN29449_c0_g1_i1.p1 TRINITY_DN29449_c0_g1~~TRINITY_DN29449_c0_g1_i1.p1  ORF type:complete len:253 (-),score=27.05 TRINITY_DN29449_c0_g1_i1:19-732(-)
MTSDRVASPRHSSFRVVFLHIAFTAHVLMWALPTFVFPWEQASRKDTVRRLANEARKGKLRDRRQLLDAIAALEACYENTEPVRFDAARISGVWGLLYNGPEDPETEVESESQRLEGPFLSRLRPVGNALGLRAGGPRQAIDISKGRVENIAPFSALGKRGELRIGGAAAPLQDGSRLGVTFDAVELSIASLPTLRLDISWANASGWVRTTFVDEAATDVHDDRSLLDLTGPAHRTG